jgi:Golgi nucleoside diphosphatase
MHLERILNFAQDLIPEQKRSSAPIYFFATAGLRVLAEDIDERIFDDDDTDSDHMLEEDDDDFGVGRISNLLLEIYNYVRDNFPFIIYRDHVKVR